MKIQKYSSIQVFKFSSNQVTKYSSLSKWVTNQPTHNVKARDPVGSKNALKIKEDCQALSPSVGDKKKKSAFPCGDCPKSYSTKYNLLKHQTQHTGTGPGQ